jgi:hypothetical protein
MGLKYICIRSVIGITLITLPDTLTMVRPLLQGPPTSPLAEQELPSGSREVHWRSFVQLSTAGHGYSQLVQVCQRVPRTSNG